MHSHTSPGHHHPPPLASPSPSYWGQRIHSDQARAFESHFIPLLPSHLHPPDHTLIHPPPLSPPRPHPAPLFAPPRRLPSTHHLLGYPGGVPRRPGATRCLDALGAPHVGAGAEVAVCKTTQENKHAAISSSDSGQRPFVRPALLLGTRQCGGLHALHSIPCPPSPASKPGFLVTSSLPIIIQ